MISDSRASNNNSDIMPIAHGASIEEGEVMMIDTTSNQNRENVG